MKERPQNSGRSDCPDHIAQVTGMAENLFKSQEEAAKWLSRPHPELNNGVPALLCETEIGAQQVKRLLRAIEWGTSV